MKGWETEKLIEAKPQTNTGYHRPKKLFMDCQKICSVFPQKKWPLISDFVPFLLNSFDRNYYFNHSPKRIIEDYLFNNNIDATVLFASPSYYHLW
jgi:hypothetical protein